MEVLSASKLKLFASLKNRKFRKLHGLCVAEGIKLVQEAIASEWKIDAIVLTDRLKDKLFLDSQLPIFTVNETQLCKVSELVNPEGCLVVIQIPQSNAFKKIEFLNQPLLVLQGISDPGNLGTLFRIADWFNISAVITDDQTADPYSHKTIRASMGSVFRVPVYRLPHFDDWLFENQKNMIAADLEGTPLPDFNPEGRNMLLLGNESAGLNIDWKKYTDIKRVGIPGSGKAESLNVSVAAGILIWQLFAQKLPDSKSD